MEEHGQLAYERSAAEVIEKTVKRGRRCWPEAELGGEVILVREVSEAVAGKAAV